MPIREGRYGRRVGGGFLDGEAISQRIRRLMDRQGLTQQALADLLGLSQPAVSHYLKGRIPPPEVLLQLARLGGTTVDWLLSGEGSDPAHRVGETAAVYGRRARLLEAFDRLPPDLQASLVQLCVRLANYAGRATNQ